jgi:hypothetical protein
MGVLFGREGQLKLDPAATESYNLPGLNGGTAATKVLKVEQWKLITTRKFTEINSRDWSYSFAVPGRYKWRCECQAIQDGNPASVNAFLNDQRVEVLMFLEGTGDAAAGDNIQGDGWIVHHEVACEARGYSRMRFVIQGTGRLNTATGNEQGT